MKNYLCQKLYMLTLLILSIAATAANYSPANAQTRPEQYWYISNTSENNTIGNTINGTSTWGLKPIGTTTVHSDFAPSRFRSKGINRAVMNGTAYSHPKGVGLVIFGRWGHTFGQSIEPYWWSASIYKKEEFSNDIDSITSVAINCVGDYPVGMDRFRPNDNISRLETRKFAVLVYETNDTIIQYGNRTGYIQFPEHCMYLPKHIDSNTYNMNELYGPLQVAPWANTDVDTYLQSWTAHGAYLLEVRDINITEFKDNAWIEFSTKNSGRAPYQYKGGNLVVVMLQVELLDVASPEPNIYPGVSPNVYSPTGNADVHLPNSTSMTDDDAGHYVRNFGDGDAVDRGWWSSKMYGSLESDYKWWTEPGRNPINLPQQNRGAAMFAARFGVTAHENKPITTYPAGLNVAQNTINFRPRLRYDYPNIPDTRRDVAKYTYVIYSPSGDIVYEALNEAGSPYIVASPGDNSEIIRARGPYARASEGRFVTNPEYYGEVLPELGQYRAVTTWYTYKESGDNSVDGGIWPTRQPQELVEYFDIVRKATTFDRTQPTWTTPITLGATLNSQLQPAVFISQFDNNIAASSMSYSIWKEDPTVAGGRDIVFNATTTTGATLLDLPGRGNIGTYTKSFERATGRFASTTEPGKFDATKFEPGKYYVNIVFNTIATAPGTEITDINELRYDSFYIGYANDIELTAITLPATDDGKEGMPSVNTIGMAYTYPSSTDLPIEYSIINMGTALCRGHILTVDIYNNAGALVQTIKDTSNLEIPFNTTRSMVSRKALNVELPGGVPSMVYSLRARVDLLNASTDEVAQDNNIFPREEYYDYAPTELVKRYFKIQESYALSIREQVQPKASDYRYPKYPIIRLRNNGAADINGTAITLDVLKPDGTTLYTETKLVSNMPIGVASESDFQFDTLFFPEEVDTYQFRYTFTLASGATGGYVRNVNIRGGLGSRDTTTIYTIGNPGTYPSIKAALQDVYTMGIQGHLVFEVNATADADDEYIVDGSYLDFRSKIVGAGSDATITFRPSPRMMMNNKPIRFIIDPATWTADIDNQDGVRGDDWFGVAFGDSYKPRIDVAAVNNVTEPRWKRYFAESNGYIIFDGGQRKNFQVELKSAFAGSTAANLLLSPIYLGMGSNNIVVRNCRVPQLGAMEAYAGSIPYAYYDEITPSMPKDFRYDDLSNYDNADGFLSTTVGILLYTRPFDLTRLDNIVYDFNKSTSDSNTIEGNLIEGFGHGIMSLGMGARVEGDSIKAMYNKGNRFVGNIIKRSGRGGILLGFEENALVSHNRLSGIGVAASGMDVYGIAIGMPATEDRSVQPNQHEWWKLDGIQLNYNNYNITVERNEIDGLRSTPLSGLIESYGILITEPVDTLKYYDKHTVLQNQLAAKYGDVATNELAASATQTYTVTNNLIYGSIVTGDVNTVANRTGIAVLPSASGRGILQSMADYDHLQHKVNRVLVANNTILLEDEWSGDDVHIIHPGVAITGIKLFDANKYEITNNAISIKIDPIHGYDYVSALSLRSQNPKQVSGSINVNNNAYSIFDKLLGYTGNDIVPHDSASFVRFFEVDEYGRLLSKGGFAQEYNKLRNWYSWTGSDKNSIEYNFAGELAEGDYFWNSEEGTRKLRISAATTERRSQLDKGCFVNYVTTDIDGVNRLLLGKNFNIGAIEFSSQHSSYDVEVLAISNPAAYLNPNNTYSAEGEEQIMLSSNRQSQDVEPRAVVKNNGTIALAQVPFICRITTNETSPVVTISDTVWTSLAAGEEKEITFFTRLNWRFTPQTYIESGARIIPDKYKAMANNVSPVYTLKILFDTAYSRQFGDANIKNDSLSIKARFFAPRSQRSLLVSAKYTYKELYTIATDGNRVGYETDLDVIAGRLNYDTVVAALAEIGYPAPTDESEPIHYDILELTAWEPRAVVYDQYSGIIYSDAYSDELDYWEKRSLLDYANNATITNKKTLIIGSEGVLSANNTNDPFDKELSNDILRSTKPMEVQQSGGDIVIRGVGHNLNLDISLSNTGYTAFNEVTFQEMGDRDPAPHSFTMVDTILGRNRAAYVQRGTQNILVMSSKLLERNVIHSAIDWRHLKNAAEFMEGIFGDVGSDINQIDPGLDINLANFNANAIGKKVLVDWTTSSEAGVGNFEIQRADVDNNLTSWFASIDTKRAKGVANTISNYNIFDENVNYGEEYAYRLKINNIDGSYTFSPVKTVNIEYANGIHFGDVTPNPVNDYANVEFTLTNKANVIITINDITGRTMMTLFNGIATAGNHPLKIDASSLATGTYTIMYNVDGNVSKATMFTIVK